LASTASIAVRVSWSAVANTSVDLAQLRERGLIADYRGPLRRGEVGQCLPLIRLVLEIDQVAGLLLMDPDDPGHSGIIKPPRPGQAGLQQLQLVPGDGDALSDMCGEPAHLTDRVPVLLTFFWRAHPAEPTSASPRARQCREIRCDLLPVPGRAVSH